MARVADYELMTNTPLLQFLKVRLPDGGYHQGLLHASQNGKVALRSFDGQETQRFTFEALDPSETLASKSQGPFWDRSTSQEEFLAAAEIYLQALQSQSLAKIVISRIKSVSSNTPAYEAFDALLSLYPEAYVFHLRTNHHGEWIGASPELLVRGEEDQSWHTIALAATRPVSEAPIAWTPKEVTEHQLVVQDISESLTSAQIPHEVGGVYNFRAGAMIHRRCDIRFHSSHTASQVSEILHPTSAISGLPRSQAYQLLRQTEKHKRGLYAGYCLLDFLPEPEAFVPLRCAQVVDGGYHLHLGAGMTAESDPVSEWEETELKATTILQSLNHAK